jgi:hypothetical protein
VPHRYPDWNHALASHFFNVERAARPVYLQADAETLQVVGVSFGVEPDQAEDAFLVAVRSRVDFRSSHPFAFVAGETRRWRASPNRAMEEPPFIALLAACVLAASQMERDDQRHIASTNYYARLNAILGSGRDGQPPDFDEITEYWDALRVWLDDDNRGRRGFCTARSAGGFRYIGWPLSQCLLREADRRRLPEFFRAAYIAPGSDLDASDVLGPLTRWCQQASCPLPERTKQLIVNGSLDTRTQIAALVAAEAGLWSGEVEDGTGRRSAQIMLQIDPRKGGRVIEIRLFPPRPPGFPEGEFAGGRQRFTLIDAGVDGWYEPLPPGDVDLAQVLDRGLELRHDGFALRWEAQPVIVAARDEVELGGFVSRPQARLGEKCAVLCRAELAGDVERLLRQHAVSGWRSATGSAGLPPGWGAFLDVELASRALTAATLRPLIPSQQTSISLEGGLRLDRQTWLAGAEPVVRVARDSPAAVPVEIDGRTVARRSEPFFRIDLARLQLPPGRHQLSVAGRVRRFETVRSGDFQRLHVAPSPVLGHRLVRDGDRYLATYPSPAAVPLEGPAPGELWIIGAELRAQPDDLPERLPQPVTLPAGARRYYLLGPRPGMVIACRDPSAPEFACFRSQRPGPPFTVVPPFPAVWTVRVSWGGTFSLRRIGPPVPPEASPWPAGDIGLWRRLVVRRYQRMPRGADGALWAAYVAQANA